jgi:hypothetical protein
VQRCPCHGRHMCTAGGWMGAHVSRAVPCLCRVSCWVRDAIDAAALLTQRSMHWSANECYQGRQFMRAWL